jgi:FkbM family methyltransferase
MSSIGDQLNLARRKFKQFGLLRFAIRAPRAAIRHATSLIWRQRYRFYRTATLTYEGTEVTAVVNSPWDLERIKGRLETFPLDSFHEADIGTSDVYYEIGANIGLNSLIMAASLDCSSITVVAFEPDLANILTLSKNVSLNGLENVLIVPIGLSDASGVTKFFLDSESPRSGQGGHSMEYIPSVHRAATHIPVMTLDHAIAQFKLESPTLVSLDVEGHEENVLIGMKETLKKRTIRMLIVEIDETYDPNQSTIPSLLAEFDYELVNYATLDHMARPHCLAKFEPKATDPRGATP